MPPPIIENSTALRFVEGNTAFGFEIDETWTNTVASATIIIEDAFTGVAVSPFSGQSATFAQTTVTKFKYDWPSAFPRGKYVAYFDYTLATGSTGSTNAREIVVDAA